MKLSSGDKSADVLIEGENARLDGRSVTFEATRRDGRIEAIRIGEDVFRLRVAREKDRVFVWCAGEVREFLRAGRRSTRVAEAVGFTAVIYACALRELARHAFPRKRGCFCGEGRRRRLS